MARFLVPQRSAVIRRRCTLEETLPQGHLARFVWTVLCAIDFAALEELYKTVQGGPGRSPYHPRVLLALWVYGLMQGVETAADIAAACANHDDFRWLAGGLKPSDQTLLNLLKHHEQVLVIWVEVLKAMQREGLIDLSDIVEDGTKLRANASPQSFRTAKEIDAFIGDLKARIATKLERWQDGQCAEALADKEIRSLRLRLLRAERAARELRDRSARRAAPPSAAPKEAHRLAQPQPAQPSADSSPLPAVPHRALPVLQSDPNSRPRARTTFKRADFRHHPERDAMVCPQDQELRLIGTYSAQNGRSSYKLYGRSDCSGCPSKSPCTESKGRRLKIPLDAVAKETNKHDVAATDAPLTGSTGASPTVATQETVVEKKDPSRGPVASVTEPEAVMMLATSEKHWEPSYNADIAITRNGIIVSQFLTKNPTDFHSFPIALAAVIASVGRPQNWIGDGHYGTHANLLLADRQGVVLFAPGNAGCANDTAATSPETESMSAATSSASATAAAEKRFRRTDFRHDAERDVLTCPAGQQLSFMGRYTYGDRSEAFRLYGRADCSGCQLKAKCTESHGRRVKVPVVSDPPSSCEQPSPDRSSSQEATGGSPQNLAALIEARDRRMKDKGDEIRRLRSSTIEPVNGQLKQHGLRRFHVHGLSRCAVVLTLACIGHDIMKWKGMEDTRKELQVAA
jgi:transposase